ncbi:MAG TPA: thiamine pyrophosphate-dependent dehydrogenase E1 component subunit alpha [Streptosporangiaceae bacterium]|nr:thiamine pyrophosphate-dependent dehydrogenase E1 component subunit alpha [Streptosporangiaceae bacterium]
MDKDERPSANATAPQLPQWLSTAEAIRLLRTMARIRAFEEAALEQYRQGAIPGSLHVSIGQEACSAGACAALRDQDLVIGTHRSHGDVIARGGDVRRMMAELFGRATGYCGGKGGSMHILDAARGVLGANGIVAAGLPIAVGVSLWTDMQGTGSVVLAFFGDGAVAKGNFHEALTLSAMWRTPTIFFCQNNQYAVSMSIRDVYPHTSIDALAASHGIPTAHIDGNDVLCVLQETRKACGRSREGGGPSVIVADTYRWMGHNVADSGAYRAADEVTAWRAKDPMERLSALLLGGDVISSAELDRLQDEVQAEIRDAVSYAQESAEPAAEDAYLDVFSEQFSVFPGMGVTVARPDPAAATY